MSEAFLWHKLACCIHIQMFDTPVDDITRPGISIALSNGNINSYPFSISLMIASLKMYPFSFADLWFPLLRAFFRSAGLYS